jgi:hypothetical protein
MMKKITLLLFLSFALWITPTFAKDAVKYTSQPDEIAVFLNDIAFAQDTILLPGNVDVQIVLPERIYQDTLILRENGERVSNYHINRNSGQVLLEWVSSSGEEAREVTLEYLVGGISWTPKYDMWLGDDEDTTVEFDFFAEIVDTDLLLDESPVRLIAGRVDTSQQFTSVSSVTFNQFAAGYDEAEATSEILTGSATIQHVYDVDTVTASPGDTLYIGLQENTLSARRLHIWNAQSDDQVTVIYKVRNDSDLPFVEGITRTYQNDLFLGSDFIELTPIGGEGSVTVGFLQDVRVNRSSTQTALLAASYEEDTLHEIDLTLTNFSDKTIDITVIDYFSSDALDFNFSVEPIRTVDNLFSWDLTVEAGETLTLSYQFKD